MKHLLLTTIAAVLLVGCGEPPSRNNLTYLPVGEDRKIERTYTWIYANDAVKMGFPKRLSFKVHNGSSWAVVGGMARVEYTKEDGELIERKYRFNVYKNRANYILPFEHGGGSVDLIWFDNDEIGSTSINIVDFTKRTDVFVHFFGYP